MIEKRVAENKRFSDRFVDSVEFKSISEFHEFITTTDTNSVFIDNERADLLDSMDTGYCAESFTGSKSFEEAEQLLVNGWESKAQELNKKLKAVEKSMAPVMKQKQVIGVAGYQPVVPLFLMGVPAAMVSKKMVPTKSKIITVVKSVSYTGMTPAYKWTEEGVKALAIVRSLEANGYRCNIDIIRAGWSMEGSQGISCRVRVKKANERLNVSKMAFALCHPSMQRRLFFRFTETYDRVTSGFKPGYGVTMNPSEIKSTLINKDEVFIPQFLNGDPSKVKKLEDIEAMTSSRMF